MGDAVDGPVYPATSGPPVVKPLSAVARFPQRKGPTSEEMLVGPGVRLQPHGCVLGDAGKMAASSSAGPVGVWRGRAETAASVSEAAKLVTPLLAEVLTLDTRGVLASADLAADTLRFCSSPLQDEEANDKASSLLGGAATCLTLSGAPGQILSHRADLWARRAAGGVDLLLRMEPSPSAGPGVKILKPGPLGAMTEAWQEVPLVELPNLLRISMASAGSGMGQQLAQVGGGGLPDAEEEASIVVHCWRRLAAGEPGAARDGLSLEQFLWYDTLTALADTAPCSETPVPSLRVALKDEGIATSSELLQQAKDRESEAQDAPRHASLEFLRQYVPVEVLQDEVLVRLLPGGSGTARVFSAELAPPGAGGERPARGRGGAQPKSLDDLFRDDLDFRKAPAWARRLGADSDPLRHHELTSVMLINERAGFALCFHCLDFCDPCDA